MTVKSQHYNIYSSAQSLNKRGNKKVKPVYEDNGDCVLLYACGWQVMSCVDNIFAEIFSDGYDFFRAEFPPTTRASECERACECDCERASASASLIN